MKVSTDVILSDLQATLNYNNQSQCIALINMKKSLMGFVYRFYEF